MTSMAAAMEVAGVGSMSSSPDSGYYSQSYSQSYSESSHFDNMFANVSQISVPGLDIEWSLNDFLPKSQNHDSHPLRTLHVSVRIPQGFVNTESQPQSHHQSPDFALLAKQAPVSRPVKHFVTCLSQYMQDGSNETLEITYILPYTSGWIIRSDFLDIRLRDLPGLQKVESFTDPLQYCYHPESTDADSTSHHELLETAVGALVLESKQITASWSAGDLLRQRLSSRWLSTEPIARKRVALVRGRPSLEIGWRVYQAAKALGVALVIVDESGHWLQEDSKSNREHREAFLTINMTQDSGLADRIADAIEAYPLPIHGIFTLSDNFLVHVAKAAEQLGLPTAPSSAHEIAVDKYLSRGLQAEPTQYARVHSGIEIEDLIARSEFIPSFPLIVKPRVGGWSSEYVYKVSDIEELIQVTQRICSKYPAGALVEPYYDGPEIDVNFVLLDGKPLFREIVDETPSKGDLENAASADFLESGMMVPTLLPEDEKEVVYESILAVLKRLGFLTGVFHVEARLSRSRMEYKEINGTIDLVEKDTTPSQRVECHLIEINARSPGLVSEILTSHTFGVDYFAARILSAVGDPNRLEAVCQPFSDTGFPDGAQYWSQLVFPPIHRGGVTLKSNPMEGLAKDHPDLAPYISDSRCDFKAGTRLPDPNETAAAYMGHFLVCSRESRRHMMVTSDRVRKEFEIEEA